MDVFNFVVSVVSTSQETNDAVIANFKKRSNWAKFYQQDFGPIKGRQVGKTMDDNGWYETVVVGQYIVESGAWWTDISKKFNAACKALRLTRDVIRLYNRTYNRVENVENEPESSLTEDDNYFVNR